MRIHLSDVDTYKIAWAAADRCEFKQNNGVVNKTKVDQKRNNFELTKEGFMGEWAVSLTLNIPVNTDLYLGPDAGYDLEFQGYTIDVKTTRAKYLLFQSIDHFKADVAVLVKVVNDYEVDVVGMISKEKFIEIHEMKDFGYGNQCVVPPEKLLPIEEFERYARRYPKYQSIEQS